MLQSSGSQIRNSVVQATHIMKPFCIHCKVQNIQAAHGWIDVTWPVGKKKNPYRVTPEGKDGIYKEQVLETCRLAIESCP